MDTKNICAEILSIYDNQSDDGQDRVLAMQLIYKLQQEIYYTDFSLNSLNEVLNLTVQIASSKKKLKQILERELLRFICYLPHHLWKRKENVAQKSDARDSKIAMSLINFAKEIYPIKIDRDSFAGKRRGYAIRILANLCFYFDVPDFLEMTKKSIKSKSKTEFLDVVESLKYYYLEISKTPDKDIIEALDKRIEKTKHRTEAVSALDLQVETGVISEFEALSRIDEWKEKNYE